MKKIDGDLWRLFVHCSNGTHNCQNCKHNNQRLDGYCCMLVDEIEKKLEVATNGKSEN